MFDKKWLKNKIKCVKIKESDDKRVVIEVIILRELPDGARYK